MAGASSPIDGVAEVAALLEEIAVILHRDLELVQRFDKTAGGRGA
jgi:hypothetical protein